VIALAALAWLLLAVLTLLRSANAPGSLAALTAETERDAQAALARANANWARATVRDGVLTLSGPAPDEAAALAATEAARAGAKRQFGWPGVYHTVNVAFETAAPLAVAPPAPDSAPGCQKMFQQALAGQEVQFFIGSARIPARANRLLDALAAVARDCAAFTITIGGHTDARGDAAYNQVLSEQRAAAVRAYLIRRGASQERLTSVGYGASRPLSTEVTEAAHRRNRRITFDVAGPQ
jgi:outer membrane protein OmpA-like peptidoglycan-associated protein